MKKTLSLNSETLRLLTGAELVRVQGGLPIDTIEVCPTVTCERSCNGTCGTNTFGWCPDPTGGGD